MPCKEGSVRYVDWDSNRTPEVRAMRGGVAGTGRTRELGAGSGKHGAMPFSTVATGTGGDVCGMSIVVAATGAGSGGGAGSVLCSERGDWEPDRIPCVVQGGFGGSRLDPLVLCTGDPDRIPLCGVLTY